MLAAALCLLAWPGPARAEECVSFGSGQFFDAIHYCVSSRLADQGSNSYGPDNLIDGDPRTAWCEGVAGFGRGETISIRVDGGIPFRRLLVRNGYGKSRETYFNNNRPRIVEFRTDTGVRTRRELPDQNAPIPVYLPELGNHRRIDMTILTVYPGSKYDDTCFDFIVPDFEYEEKLLQESRQEPPVTQAPSPQTDDKPAPGPESAEGETGEPAGTGWWDTIKQGFRQTGEGIRKRLMGDE